jgi:ATP-binding cassette, subfamily C, bacterial
MGILPIHHTFIQQINFLKQHQVVENHSKSIFSFKNSLTFNHLYFRYPGKNNAMVLHNINFNILPNQTTAIIGPSGSGKSTLIDLMTGLHFPVKGSINIDNQILNTDNLQQWRQGLAYVTQQVFLFNDTLRNNLSWMIDHADDSIIWQALTDAAANDFVRALPHELETILGDQGVILSGGEKQRIALARALICQPKY